MNPTDLIAVSAIVVGFSMTAIMFRIQRELYVRETLKLDILWLAWADYLVLGSIFLAVFGATVPLLLWPATTNALTALAAASCAAALVLQAGYIPSILAHYRIELSARRKGPRAKGEPVERLFVVGSSIVASSVFAVTLLLHWGR